MGILTNTCVVVITLEAFDHYSGKTMFCVILQGSDETFLFACFPVYDP